MNDEKVASMSNEALGIYMRLLHRAWFADVPASLPNDDAILAGIARLDVSSWQTVKPVVMSPFALSGGRYHQKKMRQVYEAVMAKLRKFSEGGIATATKRWIDKPPDSLAIGRLQPSNRNRIESNGIEEEVQDDSYKGDSPKARMNGKAKAAVELMQDCKEVLGHDEVKRWHARWLDRATVHPDKLARVIAEVRLAQKEKRINKTPAAMAEDLWKRFA